MTESRRSFDDAGITGISGVNPTWIIRNPGNELQMSCDNAGNQLALDQQVPNEAPLTIEVSSEDSRLIGDFRILREIGRGGMGVVYEAEQVSLQRRVALKTLPTAGRMDHRQILRFQNEARAAAQLHHPNIVPIYAIGSADGCHFYAMQLIEGRDIACSIRQARELIESRVTFLSGDTPHFRNQTNVRNSAARSPSAATTAGAGSHNSGQASFPSPSFIDMMAEKKPSIDAKEVFRSLVDIGIDAAEALHHAHQLGVVHRDIKPSNLILDVDGKVWVTDFGLAQIQGAGALTMTGEVIGTLRYMSPEQPLGQRVLVDQRTDIYSLGVTLYEMLTLKRAYDGEIPKEVIRQVCFDDPVQLRRVNPLVPEDLETIILKAMSKSPDDRYQTAQDLANDLKRYRDDLPILARRPTILQQTRRWIRRHTALATTMGIGGIIIFLISVAASGMIWNSLVAEKQQRKRAESLLDKSEGLRMSVHSALIKDENPGLALLLAARGAELNPGVDANSALLNAFDSNHEMKTFMPGTPCGASFDISPDGKQVITTLRRGIDPKASLPAVECSLETGAVLRRFDNGSAVTSAGYSPDGRLVLTTSAPKVRRGSVSQEIGPATPSDPDPGRAVPVVWDSSSGLLRYTFHDAILEALSGGEFSPKSDQVTLPRRDHSVAIYSLDDGQVSGLFRGHTDRVHSTIFSPDGKRIVSTSKDQTVRVWDTATGSEIRQLSVSSAEAPTATAVFAGDSETVMICSDEGTRLHSVESGQQLNPVRLPQSNAVISSDGRLLALYSKYHKTISICDLKSFRRIRSLETYERIVSASFNEQGDSLLAVTMTEPRVYRIEDGVILARCQANVRRVHSGQFSQGGSSIVTASDDGAIRHWNISSGRDQWTLTRDESPTTPSTAAFSPDSRLVAAPLNTSWHTELLDSSGNPLTSILAGRCTGNSFADGGGTERIVTVDEQQISVWHGPTSRRIATLRLETPVEEARPVPGTDRVVVVLRNKRAFLWNTETGLQDDLHHPSDRIRNFSIHPSKPRVAVVLENGDCLIRDAESDAVLRSLVHEQAVESVLYSREGSRLLTVDASGAVRLWIIDESLPPATPVEPAKIFHEPGMQCDYAVFSADESVILTWAWEDNDGIRSWRCDTGELIRKTDPVHNPQIDVHPSGRIAAIASAKNGLAVWNWDTGEFRQVSTQPCALPQLTEDRLFAIEAVPDFQHVENSPNTVFEGRDLFYRSSIVTRNLTTAEVLSTKKLPGDPWELIVNPETGQMIVSYSQFGFSVVQMVDGQEAFRATGHAGPIVFLAFSEANRKLISASLDGMVKIHDLSGRLLHLLQDHQHSVHSAALSGDGNVLATFDTSGKGFLWNVQDGTRIRELTGHSDAVHSVRFFRNDKSLLTASRKEGVRILDLVTSVESSISRDSDIVFSDVSSDGRWLLTLVDFAKPAMPELQSAGLKAVLRNLETGSEIELENKGKLISGGFRPDSAQVAVLAESGVLTIFETRDGKESTLFHGRGDGTNPNRRPILDFAFSADGNDLAVRHDSEISVWDLQLADKMISELPDREDSSEELRIPEASRAELRNRRSIGNRWSPWSPDGEWLLSETPRLKKTPRDPLGTVTRQIPRQMSDTELQRYSLITSSAVKVPRKESD